MATRMKMRGVEACIVGGRVRDLAELRSSGLPVSHTQAHRTSTASFLQNDLFFTSPPRDPSPLSSTRDQFCSYSYHNPPQSLQSISARSTSPSRFSVRDLLGLHSESSVIFHLLMFVHLPPRSCLLQIESDSLPSLLNKSELTLPQIWALAKSTVGTGAEAKVHARNTPVSICGVRITPVSRPFYDLIKFFELHS